MTISTIQFQVVKLAVDTILNGEELETVFLPKKDANNLEELIRNFNDLTNSFEINELDTTQIDIEVALDTLEKVANNIIDMYDMNIFSELADNHDFDEVCELIENESVRVWHDVYNMSDLAEQYLHETDSLQHVALDGNYIDEAQLLHDLHCNSEVSEYYYCQVKEDALEEGKTEEEAIEIASDYEVTDEDEQQFLEMVVESIVHDPTMLERYFDYEAYGRDMEIDGTFYTFDNGMIEVIW